MNYKGEEICEYYISKVLVQKKSFPFGVWSKPLNLYYSKELTKCMIENVLKWNDDDIRLKLSNKTFRENKLGGMLTSVFNNSMYLALDNAYPGKFKPWELSSVPRSFWNKETASQATKWLIEEKLKWNEDDIKKNLSCNTFRENRLIRMLTNVFNSSVYRALDNAYPGKFKPWELSNCPKFFWNMETAKEATRWLIEKKLSWNDEEIKEKLSTKTFREYGLFGMLESLFNSSMYAALNNAYPGKFKPWELSSVPRSFWNKETASRATKWLIDEKLKWNDEEIKGKLSTKTFREYGLFGMLELLFNDDIYAALDNAYPDKFKPWELFNIPFFYWNIKTGIEATRWLIEEKLKWDDKVLIKNISKKVFTENGLGGMLARVFHGSVYLAIKKSYPNKSLHKNII